MDSTRTEERALGGTNKGGSREREPRPQEGVPGLTCDEAAVQALLQLAPFDDERLPGRR